MRHVLSRLLSPVRNERGSVTVFYLLLGATLMSFSALALDTGRAFSTYSEAQRVAEAAALAGASVYMTTSPAPTAAEAEARARAYAERNYVGLHMVDAADSVGQVEVWVLDAEQKVRVRVHGTTHSVLAQFFGISSLPVSAVAAARVQGAGAASCVKPFALPDLWDERSGQDTNGNRVWEPPTGNGPNAGGESWTYDPAVDRYQKWAGDPAADANATGYGSAFRDTQGSPAYTGDEGRIITIKAGSPGNPNSNADDSDTATPNTAQIYPGLFFAFRMPEDSTMANCGNGGGSTASGAAAYSNNICTCNNTGVDFETEYDLQPGNMVGPTEQGVRDLLRGDRVTWDQYRGGTETKRAVKVALYDPAQVQSSGKSSIKFNNIALFFIENGLPGVATGPGEIRGRFVKYADGNQVGSGSMIRVLQLVE